MFARIRDFIDSDSKRAVTVAPPGFGKTAVITSAFDYVASKFNNQTRRHKHQFVGVSLMLTPLRGERVYLVWAFLRNKMRFFQESC
jgi:hypothetical protein